MRPTKTMHIFEVEKHSVKFSSNFDGGNLRTVTQIGAHKFIVESALDSYQISVTSKSFFHFSVENYPKHSRIELILEHLALLQCMGKDKVKTYLPFYSVNGQDYFRMPPHCIHINQLTTPPTLKISYAITTPIVYFSFALPYSYERYLNQMRDLPVSNNDMYIHKEVLCYSVKLNLVYMVSISSYDGITEESEIIGELSNGVIMPEKHLQPMKKYFEKPVILISGRVHPGETPASWAIQGIIKFLTSDAADAKLLRKHFQIVIVPMLNPDGVAEGLYRLDTKGHNLNRYYLISDNRQPSIYSMKHLIRHYNQSKRLLYYFDFHGHPSYKGSFMYGNAIDCIAHQAETELFARILSLTCRTFDEKCCIFDKDQMNSKDKYDMYTKQGCARVYAFKTSNILHSYTIQMGFHSCDDSPEKSHSGISNSNVCDSQFYYGKQSYYDQGVAIMTSVLLSAGLKTVQQIKRNDLRKILAKEINCRDERFKITEKKINFKKNNVNQIIETEYWKPIYERFFKDEYRSVYLKSATKLKKRQLQNNDKQGRISFTISNFLTEDSLADKNPQDSSPSRDDISVQNIKPYLIEMSEQSQKKIETTSISFTSGHSRRSAMEQSSTRGQKLARINVRANPKAFSFSKEIFKKGQIEQRIQSKIRNLKRANNLKQGDNLLDKVFGKEEQHMFSDLNFRTDDKTIPSDKVSCLKQGKQSESRLESRINEFNNMFHADQRKNSCKIKIKRNQITSLFISEMK